jgi:hypothetical protein
MQKCTPRFLKHVSKVSISKQERDRGRKHWIEEERTGGEGGVARGIISGGATNSVLTTNSHAVPTRPHVEGTFRVG